MKHDFEQLESPFLSESIVRREPAPEFESEAEQFGLGELGEAQAFDALIDSEADSEAWRDTEHGRAPEALPDHYAGMEPASWTGEDVAADQDEAEAEDEARCAPPPEPEAGDFEAELFDREAWSGSAEQLAFRDRVLAAHLAATRHNRGAPQRDLSADQRDVVPGTKGIEMRHDAAAAAGRLLAEANQHLVVAQQAGNADALRTVRLTATSGYRGSDHQRRLWLKYFPGYYKRTRAPREALAQGPHSDAAVAYMLRRKGEGGFGLGGRIAAPGYSNHQNGIAIDLWQERKPGHKIHNDSGDAPRQKWRDSWFHGWLRSHAESFGFKPLATEEWHWEYRDGSVPAKKTLPVVAAVATPQPVPERTGPRGAAGLLGGKLWTFDARVHTTKVAVFCPPAALGRSQVEVLLFAHGLLDGCPRPRSVPDGLIADSPFELGAIVARSQRPIVLVVPLLDWAHPGGAAVFGAPRQRWHALAKPANVNALVNEVLAEVGRVQSSPPPALADLIVAGHSRAYDFLEPLAQLHRDPQMQSGALARLSQVWSLDATYAGNLRAWQAWLAADPRLRVQVVYRPGTKTAAIGDTFYRARGGRLAVKQASEGHCAVPGRYLPELLAAGATTSDREAEAEDERFDGFAAGEDVEGELYLTDEAQADRLMEALESEQEPELEAWPAAAESETDEAFELEDEHYAEQALEEEETATE